MQRSYRHNGFTLEVSIEVRMTIGPSRRTPAQEGYVAVVRIFKEGNTVAVFPPLRFGEGGGRPFATQADALMGGYSAACKVVDDLLSQDRH